MYFQNTAGRAGALRRATLRERLREWYWVFRPLPFPGLRITLKRLLNYYVVRFQHARGHTRLWGKPLILTLESSNVCNLKCPVCFTGIGEAGRTRSAMPLPLFRRIMDELGDTALHVEFYNWGEPLLARHIDEMVRIAADRGISTVVSTNFSIPFDADRAERLVRSGLAILACSIDGATQAVYEQYRVSGKLDLVLRNVRLVREAKQRLGSATPRLVWSMRVFAHNQHEVDAARAMAAELDMDFAARKGWVAGAEWDDGGRFGYPVGTAPERCGFLWTHATINNDGRASPCCTTFYEEDDFGSLEPHRFMDIWNNGAYRLARQMYRDRRATAAGRDLICYQCPTTLIWENFQAHRAQGLPAIGFDPGYTTNDWFNYFWNRRPERAAGRRASPAPLPTTAAAALPAAVRVPSDGV